MGEAERRQNRWLAEQVQDNDLPAKGGDDELPSASALSQIFQPPGDEQDRGDEMYGPTEKAEDGDMGGFTDDMDTKSVRMVLKALGGEEAGTIRRCLREILLAVGGLGGSRAAYKRERGRALDRIVSEIYSHPRVAATAKLLPSLRIVPGASLDITVNQETGGPWDFNILGNRRKARKLFGEQQPVLIISSVVCTAFCALQAMNGQRRDPEIVKRERIRAMVHLRFVCELYQMQLDEGRYFTHAHPSGATSWEEGCVQDIWSHPDVERIISH